MKNRLLVAALLSLVPSLFAAEAGKSTYRGWQSLALKNGLIEVQVVPEIGGRVIQLKLGDHEYLWVNDALAGKAPSATGLAPDGGWLNYGGDKLWPAPQGWDNDQQWPGPPDAVLDGSAHDGAIVDAGGKDAAIRLVSQKDKRSGIQFMRTVRVHDDTTRVSFETTMTNVDTKPRRWGIWQVTQLDAGNHGKPGYNPAIRQYSPLNPKSIFPRGFAEMFGLINNPSYKTDAGKSMLVAHYEGLVGKAGMDNSAGWIATVDGTAGYVFVERFKYFPDRQYPDNTSATFWQNAAGKFVCGTNVAEITESDAEKSRLVESEVISPYASLKPGESYTCHNEWFAANIGGDLPILDCSPIGVLCSGPMATTDEKFTVRYGVFYSGTAEIFKSEKLAATVPVSPTQPLLIEMAASARSTVTTVTVVIKDRNGKVIGKLPMWFRGC